MLKISARAPAKLNLGLEVVGRRADGYHDIVTIVQTVSRYDLLTLTSTPSSSEIEVQLIGEASIGPVNLVDLALARLQAVLGTSEGARVRLRKAIPIAAGLGGASSDAAASLTAGQQVWHARLHPVELRRVAAELGSDVPFFLRGGTALVTGRGDQVQRLPDLPLVWFVVVSPTILIPEKTTTLYQALSTGDFTSGARVMGQADALRGGKVLDPEHLGNAFARPLYELSPTLSDVAATLRGAGAPFVALSGAGPSHYTAVNNGRLASSLAKRLVRDLGPTATVFTCRPVPSSHPPGSVTRAIA